MAADAEKPVGMLSDSAEKFSSLPFREGEQRCVRRADDEIQLAIAQSLESLRHREQKIYGSIKALGFEEAQFNRCNDGKIGVGNKIGNGDADHILSSVETNCLGLR